MWQAMSTSLEEENSNCHFPGKVPVPGVLSTFGAVPVNVPVFKFALKTDRGEKGDREKFEGDSGE